MQVNRPTSHSLRRNSGIDFLDFEKPVVENINVAFTKHGYAFLIIETGGPHADLTDDYALVPAEMKPLQTILIKKLYVLLNAGKLRKTL